MKNFLVISSSVPYDGIGLAGGKIHNYYLKRLNQEQDFKVKLISFAPPTDVGKIDLDRYKVDYHVTVYENQWDKKLYRLFLNLPNKYNPFDKTGGVVHGFDKTVILKKLKSLKAQGYIPDIISLEWTRIALMIEDIKKIYPDAFYIAVEHDVSYLGFERKYRFENNFFKKSLSKIKFVNEKKSEIDALRKFDFIVTLNQKDKDLLIEEGFKPDRITCITPYYDEIGRIKSDYNNKNITFYGAMHREENYLSAVWFIENVFNRLGDREAKFYIVGSKPHPMLKKYESENIVITGFVDDVRYYFENCVCMVVPLVLGAGIKIKVLEAMSAGSLVLTNKIGIEGIPARNEIEYLHCETPQEYIRTINKIFKGEIDIQGITENAKKMMEKNFKLDESYKNYKETILNLVR